MLEPHPDAPQSTEIKPFLEELKLLKRVAINPQDNTEKLIAITTPPITASAFIGVTSEFFQHVTSAGLEPLYGPVVDLIKTNLAFKNFVYSGSDFVATFAWTTFGGTVAIGLKQMTDRRISEYYSSLRQKTSDPNVLESYRNHEEMYKAVFGFTEYSATSILTLIMSSSWILDELSQAVATHQFDLEKHTFQTEDLTAYVAGIALGHLFFAGSLAYMYIKNHMK